MWRNRMSIRIVQLGSARQKNEGIRIGTVRRPPRGVSKKNYRKLDFYDVWLPELAPSLSLLKAIKESDSNSRTWQKFMLRYKREMELPPAVRIISLLALLSLSTNFSVGCYCADENHCHRSILKRILKSHGALIQETVPAGKSAHNS
jgi:uncharacterized protein YeaO (DUF488 family)